MSVNSALSGEIPVYVLFTERTRYALPSESAKSDRSSDGRPSGSTLPRKVHGPRGEAAVATPARRSVYFVLSRWNHSTKPRVAGLYSTFGRSTTTVAASTCSAAAIVARVSTTPSGVHGPCSAALE